MMFKFTHLIKKVPSNFAKIIFPLIFLTIFLSPLVYYWGLLWFSGISSNYNSYFIINKDGIVQFQKTKPKSWTTIKEAPLSVVWPIIVSEDWDFYQHGGVDWQQLKIVLLDGLKNLEIKRGASTITQQVIKNLFLSDERSFFRKFNEIILAYYLEGKVGKKWILEQYINLAEFDKGVYGIKNASRHYFSKAPYQLRFKEGAFLAMLLPSPKKYSISYYKRDLTNFARKQVTRILGKLVVAKILTREVMQEELSQPFSWEKSPEVLEMNVLESIIDKIKKGEEFTEEEIESPAGEANINKSEQEETPVQEENTSVEDNPPLEEQVSSPEPINELETNQEINTQEGEE
jgi:monofunctional biosynthetic peptidoglycan transglycosylase